MYDFNICSSSRLERKERKRKQPYRTTEVTHIRFSKHTDQVLFIAPQGPGSHDTRLYTAFSEAHKIFQGTIVGSHNGEVLQ